MNIPNFASSYQEGSGLESKLSQSGDQSGSKKDRLDSLEIGQFLFRLKADQTNL